MPRMILLSVCLISVGLLGCNDERKPGDPIAEAAFSEVMAASWCARTEECRRGMFEDKWTDQEDCIADNLNDWQDRFDSFANAGCSYDPAGGGDFDASMAEMSCGDFYQEFYLDDLELPFLCAAAGG